MEKYIKRLPDGTYKGYRILEPLEIIEKGDLFELHRNTFSYCESSIGNISENEFGFDCLILRPIKQNYNIII